MLGEIAPDVSSSGLRLVDGGALDPLVQPSCSLAVQLRRATGSVVGRAVELEAIAREIRDAKTRLSAVTLEGEPGIGKTRLLLAAADLATATGFTTVAVAADEEIRGPFLLARSLFASTAIRDLAQGTSAEGAVRRVVDAISGRDEPGFESLSPDAKQLRAFDLAGVAIGALADARPLAVFLDDVQWADDDTLRLLRYVVRSDADRPIFLFLTIRPEELAQVTEAVNFVADMERMGLVRRLRVGRFTSVETTELLRHVLGGPVEAASAAAMHAQSEGVPFIVEELARTHREAGTLQLLDGEWRLGRNAARLVPSAVRTLISRRAARLPAPTRAVLADASILGRSFSLRDLAAVRAATGPAAGAAAGEDGADGSGGDLTEELKPAVQAGLLLPHPAGDAADYTFTHDQVRQFALNQLSQARARRVHAAVVDLLLEGGEPAPAGLPMLAQHALAAGDTERAARFSIQAATAALDSNAPEEALRLVEAALPIVSAPRDRRQLLLTRDDAYAALRRPQERLDGLTELAALAEASRDATLELEVQLRRVAAFRSSDDPETAAELARRLRTRAAERGDRAFELRANLELGQAAMRSPLGESFGSAGSEVDRAGGEEAYTRAAALAEELGDERSLAGALREIAMIELSKARDWFSGAVRAGQAIEFMQEINAGATLDDVLPTLPIAGSVYKATSSLERALAIYERLDDRTGVMSTVIAMAYTAYAPIIHLASSARHLEEIRRVRSRLAELVTESERDRQELQMLYGIAVYARAKVVPDLAITRAVDTYRAARIQGDRSVEFLAAGNAAMAHLDLGDVAEAERWLASAATVLSAVPSTLRARQLATWRGLARAAAGDAAGMRHELESAVRLATEQGRAPARCEALARLALESARLGAATADAELLELADRTIDQVRDLAAQLPGHAPWGAQADAARATVALARGDIAAAVESGAAAMEALRSSYHEDLSLDVVVPAARAIFAGAPPEAQAPVRNYLQVALTRIAQGMADETVRVRWLRGPVGKALVELVGPIEGADAFGPDGAHTEATAHGAGPDLDTFDRRLLHLLTEGLTNGEMAVQLGLDEEAVGARLAKLLARLGASSRAEATSLAFRGLAPVGTR
ncbi:MAG TPA: AAA family ATPase [Candidatus Limnocylindrales bacterium]|nr:AAA family ATPase [Candidatus Limnocylindrales bacterium]